MDIGRRPFVPSIPKESRMTRRTLLPASAALLGALFAVGAVAQSAENRDAPLPQAPGTVLSDAQPLPAEDRDSPGALLLQQSPVRAQRATPAAEVGAGVRAVGRNVTQVLGGPGTAPPVADAQPEDKFNKN
jgi:hypothetical protein